ncbi:MAG: metal ABC transporter permease [Calditrichaeota bacterium]|nr:metal ABC transporter permease [Calditrichota bacterium]
MVFGRQVTAVTEAFKQGQPRTDMQFRFWNFFFYLSIGLSIVFAVRVGGVIPVFAYLVVPSVSAILVSQRPLVVAILAPAFAVLVSLFGLYFSFSLDFPAGPSIVMVSGFYWQGVALLNWLPPGNRH